MGMPGLNNMWIHWNRTPPFLTYRWYSDYQLDPSPRYKAIHNTTCTPAVIHRILLACLVSRYWTYVTVKPHFYTIVYFNNVWKWPVFIDIRASHSSLTGRCYLNTANLWLWLHWFCSVLKRQYHRFFQQSLLSYYFGTSDVTQRDISCRQKSGLNLRTAKLSPGAPSC